MSDKAVCKTALATPGLLNVKYKNREINTFGLNGRHNIRHSSRKGFKKGKFSTFCG